MSRKKTDGVCLCKSCRRELPPNSIYCCWCGAKQLKDKKEIKVPPPRQLPSGSWFGRVTVSGERVPITAETEAQYYAQARAVKLGLVEAAKKPKPLPLDAAITQYIDSRRGSVSPSTIATYKKKQRLYFKDLMKTDIHCITPDMLQIQIQKMIRTPGSKGEKLSPKTIDDTYKFILTVLKYHKVVLDTSKLSTPKVPASPFAILTDKEQGDLIRAAAGDPCEIQILLALWLGLRRSEIIALEKSDFDFAHKQVRIGKALVRDENGVYVEKSTKTPKSARTINCPDYILDKVRPLPDGKLYQNDPNYILKCLHRICENAGLPSVRLHDLRHINSSVGLKLGVPDKYMMERNGWSTKETMLYRYQHTYAAEKDATDEAINKHFEGLLSGKNGNENGNGSEKVSVFNAHSA